MCGLCTVGLLCKPCAQDRQPAVPFAEAAGALAEAGVAGLVMAFVASILLNIVFYTLVSGAAPIADVLGLLSPMIIGVVVGETVSFVARGRVTSLLRVVAALDILLPVIGSRLLVAYLYTGNAANALTPLMFVVVFFACVTATIASGRVRARG